MINRCVNAEGIPLEDLKTLISQVIKPQGEEFKKVLKILNITRLFVNAGTRKLSIKTLITSKSLKQND